MNAENLTQEVGKLEESLNKALAISEQEISGKAKNMTEAEIQRQKMQVLIDQKETQLKHKDNELEDAEDQYSIL